MTDETKNLFDAPWNASYDGEAEMLEVYDADHDRVCIIDYLADAKHAERIARMPELYDALQEAIFEINRLTEAWENGVDFGSYCDSCEKLPHQNTFEWQVLLQKVGDGE